MLVHGGGHAKWSFEQYARVLSEGGYALLERRSASATAGASAFS